MPPGAKPPGPWWAVGTEHEWRRPEEDPGARHLDTWMRGRQAQRGAMDAKLGAVWDRYYTRWRAAWRSKWVYLGTPRPGAGRDMNPPTTARPHMLDLVYWTTAALAVRRSMLGRGHTVPEVPGSASVLVQAKKAVDEAVDSLARKAKAAAGLPWGLMFGTAAALAVAVYLYRSDDGR